MGLYLCVFDGDEEVDGVEVGSYADFGFLRDLIRDRLENGVRGSRFPLFMLHSDCDGEWRPAELEALSRELSTIESELAWSPPLSWPAGWQKEVARALGLTPKNLADCFTDVDGEPLFERLQGLCRVGSERGLPILFQ